jgi:hypothetical protein
MMRHQRQSVEAILDGYFRDSIMSAPKERRQRRVVNEIESESWERKCKE